MQWSFRSVVTFAQLMEVNSEALEGLRILGDSTFVPDAAFGSLAEDSFNFATGLISSDNFQGRAFLLD